MSYILEALKKAQAERQLGSSPTLHAPTLQTAEQRPAARFSMPLLAAVVGMAAVIGVLLVLVWRPSGQVAATTPVATAPTVTPPAPQSQPAQASPVQTAPTPLPAPVADLPQSVANLARATSPSAAPAAAAVAAPAAAKPAVSEEPVVNLRELPEPIQRSIPPVTVGGYIYSKNSADSLLLVGKVLRREGEEVAPGLILEKLQPKEAIFNYKGYRYRVPY
jgi:general secretion pathway protein B